MAKKKVLILRTCEWNMSSYNGFKWPKSGYVEASDWNPGRFCGCGLHGWLWGEGDGSLGNWGLDAKWLVVEVDADKVIDLDGKVKFPSGNVVFCGTRLDATNYLVKEAPGKAVIGAMATAGDGGTATAGYKGVAVVGHRGTATAGEYGMATAGCDGTATAGHDGTATAGEYGTATVGDYGMAKAGYKGRAIAKGYGGTAMVGPRGWAMAGHNGKLCIEYYDGRRYRIKVAHVGEGGILPDKPYRLGDLLNFVEVDNG